LDVGSTADLASLTGWPIVLVVDARSQGASAAAQVLGFHRYRDDIDIAGVIFNRVGSEKHQNVIRAAMARVVPEIPVLGMIPWQADLQLPSRHLGLIQAAEHDGLKSIIDRAALTMERHVDVGQLHDLATGWQASGQVQPLAPLGQHIAVAQDEAFAFAYPAVLQGWRNQGVELSFFSPLEDQGPAAGADAVYLPGGYPELHAYRLSSAVNFIFGVQKAAREGKTIYGECGGYMVLGDAIIDGEGIRHPMLGLLPLQTSFAKRKLHLGYRQLALQSDTPLGKAGTKFRGHEFHYASIVDKGLAANLFDAADAEGLSLGPIGLQVLNVFGSFAHVVDKV
jgi:cobyrinic acid a,c-diamide synthase